MKAFEIWLLSAKNHLGVLFQIPKLSPEAGCARYDEEQKRCYQTRWIRPVQHTMGTPFLSQRCRYGINWLTLCSSNTPAKAVHKFSFSESKDVLAERRSSMYTKEQSASSFYYMSRQSTDVEASKAQHKKRIEGELENFHRKYGRLS